MANRSTGLVHMKKTPCKSCQRRREAMARAWRKVKSNWSKK